MRQNLPAINAREEYQAYVQDLHFRRTRLAQEGGTDEEYGDPKWQPLPFEAWQQLPVKPALEMRTTNNYQYHLWKPERAADDELVLVNVARFDKAFQQDTGFYVGAGGEGGIKGRYDRFGRWLDKDFGNRYRIKAPEVYVDADGKVSFTNGRHRYAWLRDHGVTTMPMAMPKEAAARARAHGLIAQFRAGGYLIDEFVAG